MKKSYQAENYLLNAMLNYIVIMMGLLSDGDLLTIKILLTSVVCRVWIKPDVPNLVTRNAIYGSIAHLREDATLQTFTNIKMASAG